jgi:hypothetical protein
MRHMLDLAPELIVTMLETLQFDALLASRAVCSVMRSHVLNVTRVVLQRKEQICVPLLQTLGQSLTWLELEGAMPDWLPRLGCVMAVLPHLQRLFIRRAKVAALNRLSTALADNASLCIAGALQAGACRSLVHLNIDERLPEEKVSVTRRPRSTPSATAVRLWRSATSPASFPSAIRSTAARAGSSVRIQAGPTPMDGAVGFA